MSVVTPRVRWGSTRTVGSIGHWWNGARRETNLFAGEAVTKQLSPPQILHVIPCDGDIS
jgi:hypothetical protein